MGEKSVGDGKRGGGGEAPGKRQERGKEGEVAEEEVPQRLWGQTLLDEAKLSKHRVAVLRAVWEVCMDLIPQ